MKPYSAYKDSGQAWLGRIPSHWNLLPNIAIFRERIERGYADENLLSVTQDRGIIPQTQLTEKKDSSNEDKSNYKFVKVGDIAYNKMRMWQGAVGYSELQGIVSPAYVVIKTIGNNNPRFFYFLFKTPLYNTYSYIYSYGISKDQLSLRYEDFKRMISPIPPRTEQDTIVAFLDFKLADIDRYIAEKERLIELLQEEFHAVIENEINSYSHIAQARLGYYVNLKTGFPFVSESYTLDEKDIRLLRGINVTPNGIRWDDVVRWPHSNMHGLEDYLLKVGDLVMGMDRPWVNDGIRVAQIGVSDIPSLLLQRVARLRARKTLRQDYLKMLLQSSAFQNYFEPILSGISVPHISPKQILDFRISIPSLEEQDRVIQLRKIYDEKIAQAVLATEQEIKLVNEYRTALIAEAVTGKIDVRN